MYRGKYSVYVVFGTVCGFMHSLGVLERIFLPMDKVGLMYIVTFDVSNSVQSIV